MGRRIGILGGTFDPPHVGHLLAALDARERLSLDEVVLVPTARQPLKDAAASAAASHRLAMCRLLVDGIPGLRVDPIEVEREGLSFTVDTLRALRDRAPDASFAFLLGEDAAASLPQWREAAKLPSLARFVVLTRGADLVDPPPGIEVERLPTRRIEVSSTEIRARSRAGLSIRGMVTDPVADYIAAHGLYSQTTG